MPEQTKLDWNALLNEALTAPGNLHGVYDRFHEYSLTNYLLFMMQGIHEPVASYKRWQSLGRHVLQGAKAKEVMLGETRYAAQIDDGVMRLIEHGGMPLNDNMKVVESGGFDPNLAAPKNKPEN